MSKWTAGALAQHVAALFAAHDRLHEQEQQSVQRATDALNERLAGVNEFRQQLRDQQGTFVTREVYDERHENLRREIQQIREGLAGRDELITAFRGVLNDVETLKTGSASRTAVDSYRRWLIGLTVAVALAIIAGAVTVVATFLSRHP